MENIGDSSLGAQVMSRRQFLGLAALFGTGVALQACGLPPDSQSPRLPTEGPPAGLPNPTPVESETLYKGAVESLNGKPLLGLEARRNYLNALYGTGFPMFQKGADDMAKLTRLQDNPAMLPPYVSEAATPLVITHSYSADKNVSYAALEGIPDELGLLQLHVGEEVKTFKQLKVVDIGIHLGLNEAMKLGGPDVISFYLMKEYTTIAAFLSIGRDFLSLLEADGLFVTKSDGAFLQHSLERVKAGIKLFLHLATDRNTMEWKVADAAPVLMIGSGIGYLVSTNKWPTLSPEGAGHFYRAAEIVAETPGLLDGLRGVIDGWTNSGSLLFPMESASRFLGNPDENPIVKGSLQLARELEERSRSLRGDRYLMSTSAIDFWRTATT